MIIGRSRKGEDEKRGGGASGDNEGVEREASGGGRQGEGRISDGVELGIKDGRGRFRDEFEEEGGEEEGEEEEGEGSDRRSRRE